MEFDEAIKARIAAVADESRDFTADEFLAALNDYIDSLRSHGYGSSSLKTAGHALTVLYLFLDIHSLGFGSCTLTVCADSETSKIRWPCSPTT